MPHAKKYPSMACPTELGGVLPMTLSTGFSQYTFSLFKFTVS